ncbi:hypothetical protein RYX36_023529 [Vicia faba]
MDFKGGTHRNSSKIGEKEIEESRAGKEAIHVETSAGHPTFTPESLRTDRKIQSITRKQPRSAISVSLHRHQLYPERNRSTPRERSMYCTPRPSFDFPQPTTQTSDRPLQAVVRSPFTLSPT